MADKEHLKILKQGVAVWNQWRRVEPTIIPDLSHADLNNGTDLSNADLRGTNLSDADLSNANLSDANFSGADLSGADLSEANLRVADLSEADLSGADLGKANLSDANFSEADLSGADLGEADLLEIDLCGADLRGANLNGANLRESNLREANLRGANVSGANLSMADLSEADLSMADLSEADLSGANFSGTDMRWARLYETIFVNTDLSKAKGLDECYHYGPSSVDHRTLQRSGPLSKEFLRGCGLPDNLIKSLKDLLSESQYDSCFICHSSKDNGFVKQLYEDLRSRGAFCWHYGYDMQGGKTLNEQIVQAIKSQKRLLIVLSEHSMSSRWVKTEITEAYEREVKEKRRVLFPIRLIEMEKIEEWECFDTDLGTDLAKQVRKYYIPDFQNWKDAGAYQESLAKLLRDLKHTDEQGSASELQ